MQKKRILFIAQSTKSWMGGVYYIKNQIVQLLSYVPARKKIRIYLYTNEECAREYMQLSNYANVSILYMEKISTKSFVQICKMIPDLDADIAYLVWKYNISYIFPYFPKEKVNKILFLKKSISWIPDFQHVHIPQIFSKKEIAYREREFKEVAYGHEKLVLSSQDAYMDYIKKYPNCGENIYIIPFCSALDKKIVQKNNVEKVKAKYGIRGNYFIICNQFWMHKNHMFAFKALKKALETSPDIVIVCTGKLSDYRNRNYIYEIKEYIANNGMQKNVFLLGLIDKADQIQLIKGAIALIQPSLFEGWGTSVEDAKTLNKKILLSDIPVHHEQMNHNCQLFSTVSPEELAKLILQLWEKEKNCLQRSGFSFGDAPKYGALFYKMLFNT